jgi:hypothetical protein
LPTSCDCKGCRQVRPVKNAGHEDRVGRSSRSLCPQPYGGHQRPIDLVCPLSPPTPPRARRVGSSGQMTRNENQTLPQTH